MSKEQSGENPKLPSKRGRPVDAEKDRVTFHISIDTRLQIQKLIPDMGKSLSMVVRNLVNLGLELVGLSDKGLTFPRSGHLDEWLANYTSLGTELLIACETLNLSAPLPGQVAIWLLDQMSFGSNDPQVINDKEDTSNNLLERIRLGRKLQAFSSSQGIELPQSEEFTTWLGQLHSYAAIGQEFVSTCGILGLQPPEPGKLSEWLQEFLGFKNLASELVIECEKLGIEPPKPGEVGVWLRLMSNVVSERLTQERELPSTDNCLSEGSEEMFLEHLLMLSGLPSEDEERNIARRFGVDPAHLKELLKRVKFE
jgi:hypothetical protein